MKTNSYAHVWLSVLLANLLIAALAFVRLADLPELPLRLGDDLTVQAVSDELEPGEAGISLARGDQISGLAGQALGDLSDLVLVSRSVVRAQGVEAGSLDYQAIRPLHRFTLTLGGQTEDGKALPPGVEPTDVLVEVDGRTLPGKVGPEGLRSIVASRPEAVLGFERKNAVFTGKIPITQSSLHFVWLVAFGIAGLMTLILWRFHSPRNPLRFSLLMACQSILLAMASLIVFKFQWVMSDAILAGMVATAMILCRPVAYVGHAWVEDGRPSIGTWFALALSLISCVVVCVSIGLDILSCRKALMLAGVVGFFFIFYELVAGFSGGRSDPRTERSMYLVGIIVITVVSSLVAYLMDPVGFLEISWVGFVVAVLGLMWTGDVIVSLRGPSLSELDEVRTPEFRQRKIREYFSEFQEEFPGCKLRAVLYKPGASVILGEGLTGFEVRPTDKALHDAVSILVAERAQVPWIGPGESPLQGIAKTMQIPLLVELPPPPSGIVIPDLTLVVTAIWTSRAGETIPNCSADVVERVFASMNSVIWAAMVVEGLGLESSSIVLPEPSIAPEIVDELREEIAELKAVLKTRELEVEDAEIRCDAFGSQTFGDLQGAVERMEELLEPGLLDAVKFLVESQEPVVLAGAWGSGKRFVGACISVLDQHFGPHAVMLDVGQFSDESGRSNVDDFPTQHFLAAEGGVLFVRSAAMLSAQQLKALCHRSEGRFRLLLSFDDPHAESRSVLDGYSAEVSELLGHRELVIPSFHRREVKQTIVRYLVESASLSLNREVVGIASDALQTFQSYHFAGEIAECKTLIWAAVSRSQKEVLDAEDFGFSSNP